MIYVFEGLDGTGKTTTYEMIKEAETDGRTKFVSESYTPSATERLGRVTKFINNASEDNMVIYDRATVIDDLVYNEVIENARPIVRNRLKEIKDVFNKGLATVIHFHTDADELSGRLNHRGDDYVKLEDLLTLAANYSEVYEELGITPIIVDTTGKNKRDVAREVARIIYGKKTFKMAHIVPTSSFDATNVDGYHMVLSHLIDDPVYSRFYKEVASRERSFVLMDNGAAENSLLSNIELLRAYEKINPTEIVLPDVLCDSNATQRTTELALKVFLSEKVPYSFMAVPQGSTFEEWRWSAEKLIQINEIDSIGISKFLTLETGDELVRMKAAMFIDKMMRLYDRPNLEVHLLGLTEQPWIVRNIQETFDFVRSCDSAYAHILSKVGQRVDKLTIRTIGEIDFLGDPRQALLNSNISRLNEALGVNSNRFDSTWY